MIKLIKPISHIIDKLKIFAGEYYYLIFLIHWSVLDDNNNINNLH